MTSAPTAADPAAEALLERYNATYRERSIDVAGVELHPNAAGVRVGGLNVDAVDRYADSLGDGQALPMVIVHEDGDGRRQVLGGCHRWKAYETNDYTDAEVYLVHELAPAVQAAIAVEHNATHGLTLTTADRIRNAQDLIALGMTEANAAKAAGISRGSLQRVSAAERGSRRARTAKCAATFLELPSTSQARLTTLAHDQVFAEAVRTAAQLDLTSSEVETLLSRVKDAGDDVDDQLDAVEAFEEEAIDSIRSTGGTAPPPVKASGERRNLSAWWRATALQLLEDGAADDVVSNCPPDFRGPMADLAQRLADRALEISRSLR